MNKIFIMGMTLFIIIFIVGCGGKMTDEEVKQELNALSDEELVMISAEDQGNVAGQAVKPASKPTSAKVATLKKQPLVQNSAQSCQEAGSRVTYKIGGVTKSFVDDCVGSKIRDYYCQSNTLKIKDTACGKQETCRNGKCACLSECTAAQTKCEGRLIKKCGQFDRDACLEFSVPADCGGVYICKEDQCVKNKDEIMARVIAKIIALSKQENQEK